MRHPSKFVKAITGTVAATIAAGLGNAMADGNLTPQEAIASFGLGLAAGAAVYFAPRNAA